MTSVWAVITSIFEAVPKVLDAITVVVNWFLRLKEAQREVSDVADIEKRLLDERTSQSEFDRGM